jgi:hypothetical protein
MSYFFRFTPVVKKQILSFRASLVELFSKKIFGRALKKTEKMELKYLKKLYQTNLK